MDGEFTTGTIHFITKNNFQSPVANFSIDKKTYSINAAYLFKHYDEGEKVSIIYDTRNAQHAAVYSWWGYWIKWSELLASIIFTIVFVFVAKEITSNPTPEVLIEEIENENKKRG